LKRLLQLRGAWIVPHSSTQCLATVALRLGDATWGCTSLKMPCLQLLYRPASHPTLENATPAAPGRWCSPAKYDNYRRRSASTTFGLASRSLLTLNRIVPRAAACAKFRQRGSASDQLRNAVLSFRNNDSLCNGAQAIGARGRGASRGGDQLSERRWLRPVCGRGEAAARGGCGRGARRGESWWRPQKAAHGCRHHLGQSPCTSEASSEGRNSACVPERTHTDDASDATYMHTMAHGA